MGIIIPSRRSPRAPKNGLYGSLTRLKARRGFIQGIRLAECPQESISVTPLGISASRLYVFENKETGQVLEIPGAKLAGEGFTFTLPKRSAAIWFYRIKD